MSAQRVHGVQRAQKVLLANWIPDTCGFFAGLGGMLLLLVIIGWLSQDPVPPPQPTAAIQVLQPKKPPPPPPEEIAKAQVEQAPPPTMPQLEAPALDNALALPTADSDEVAFDSWNPSESDLSNLPSGAPIPEASDLAQVGAGFQQAQRHALPKGF